MPFHLQRVFEAEWPSLPGFILPKYRKRTQMHEKTLGQNTYQALFDRNDFRYQKIYDMVFFDLGYSESTINMPPSEKATQISTERAQAFEAFKCFTEQNDRKVVSSARDVATLNIIREAALEALHDLQDALVIEQMGWKPIDSRYKKWQGAELPPSDVAVGFEMFERNLQESEYSHCVNAIIRRTYSMVTWLIPSAECNKCEPSSMQALLACRSLIDGDASPEDAQQLYRFIQSLEILHDRDFEEIRASVTSVRSPQSEPRSASVERSSEIKPGDTALLSLPSFENFNPQLHRDFWRVVLKLSASGRFFSHADFDEEYKNEPFYRNIQYRRTTKWLTAMSVQWPEEISPLVIDGLTKRSRLYKLNPDWLSKRAAK